MRYKLVTLPKTTQKMPVINVTPGSHTFQATAGLSQNLVLNANTANVADSSYTFILHDNTIVSMVVQEGAGGNVGATTPFFLGEDDAPNSKTLVAQSVKISPVGVQNIASTQVTVIGNDTGATSSVTITNRVTLSSLTALSGI